MAAKESKREEQGEIRLDRPLQTGSALGADTLERRAFAGRVVQVLERISPDAGLVVSVEGAWGCGKTSLLAMVEDLLLCTKGDKRPVVVHFNPWLVGDRDALLRQFLASIANAVKLTDHAKEGKRVAKELKTYSKAFDVLKLIPGAEPWASIVKSVVESMGNATEAVFDYKTPDIEARKHDLERALRKFPQRIVVLIDDLDRLYPAEVYEMVRIIKAVGDLPSVGYVLAWDEKFVSAALDRLNVPFASAYLDKVVQVRLPVPPLSFTQRVAQMNAGLARLPSEACETHFPSHENRLGSVFHHGLSELMEHPRDVVRLFDVLMSIEPNLRGEVNLGDLMGLAALMTKAPNVFSLLRSTPQAFVGRRPGSQASMEKPEDVIDSFSADREGAINACGNPAAVRELVHWLFPKTAKADKAFTFDRVVFTEGHLGHPDRLSVALQMSAGQGDVSMVNVRRFVFQPSEREAIAVGLDEQGCFEFLIYLVETLEALSEDVEIDSETLCIALARLVDTPPFVLHARNRREVFLLSADRLALRAIKALGKRMQQDAMAQLAERLIGDEEALSIAVAVAFESYVKDERDDDAKALVRASTDSKDRTLNELGNNLERAARSGALFNKLRSAINLWLAPRLVPERCKALFDAIREQDPSLDWFALALMEGSFDSVKGQRYALPKEIERIEAYVAMDFLKEHGAARLKDEALGLPARAAWSAVVKGKEFYGVDGSVAER